MQVDGQGCYRKPWVHI